MKANIIDTIKNNMFERAENLTTSGEKELKKSSADWLDYVENHPMQTLLFGAAIMLAIKGLFK